MTEVLFARLDEVQPLSGVLTDIDALGAGIVVKTSVSAVAARTLTGTANEITVADGDGVAGDPTVSLPAALTFTGKTVTGGIFNQPVLTVLDDEFLLQDDGDPTKQLAFQLSGISASNTRTITMIDEDLTLVGLTNVQTLTGKTIDLTDNTITGTTAEFNTALSDGDFATLAGTETLTGKTFDLASNTLTGTIAQFNTALSDANFATLAGTETLTGKTLDLASNTVTMTFAQLNTAVSDGNVANASQNITISGIIETPVNKNYRIVERWPFAGTVTKFYAKTSTGTITAGLEINGSAVTNGSINVTSTQGSATPSAANTFAIGDTLEIETTSNSSSADLSFVVEYTRTLA